MPDHGAVSTYWTLRNEENSGDEFVINTFPCVICNKSMTIILPVESIKDWIVNNGPFSDDVDEIDAFHLTYGIHYPECWVQLLPEPFGKGCRITIH